jgi:hypothetical protein
VVVVAVVAVVAKPIRFAATQQRFQCEAGGIFTLKSLTPERIFREIWETFLIREPKAIGKEALAQRPYKLTQVRGTLKLILAARGHVGECL